MSNIYFARAITLLAFSLACSLSSLAEEKPFKFGISAPFSGALAEYGAAVRNGVELAQKESPDGYKNIEISFEDSQWDPKTAIIAFNTLKDIKKVSLVYNWGNPTSEAVAPVAERYKFPLLVMSSDHKIVQGKNYVIRTISPGDLLGRTFGKYLLSKGYKRIGFVIVDNSYVRSLFDGVTAELASAGGVTEIVEQVSFDQQDFKSAITKIRGRSYDALGVFVISGQVSSFLKQSASLGLSLPIIGTDFFGSKTEIQSAGPAMNHAVFPDLGVSNEFREKYSKAYGNDIQIAFAANAYDVMTVVGKEFSTPGSNNLKAEEILAKIKTTKHLKGAHGDFTFEDSKEYGPMLATPIVIREVVGDEIVDIK